MKRMLAVALVVVLTAVGCASSTPVTSSAPSGAAEPPSSTTSSTIARPTTFKVGDKVTYRGDISVQVLSYEQGVAPPNRFLVPAAGNEFAVLDVEVCAGPTAAVSYNVLGFELQMPDNRRYSGSFGEVRAPTLGSGDLPAGSGCKRGWVAQQAPIGQRPVYVIWNYSQLAEAKWAV